MQPTHLANAISQCSNPHIIIIEDDPEVVVKQEPCIKEEPKQEEQNQRIKQLSHRQWKPKQIKMSELEGTLTSKMVEPKELKRAHAQSHQEVKDKQKNIIAFVKQTLKEANNCWNTGQYGQAAEFYSQVAYNGGAKTCLSKTSYIQVFRDLYLSHFEQWKKVECFKGKAELVEDARYSLDHYLKEEIKGDLRLSHFRDFSDTVFALAVKLVQDQCEVSFEHWVSLLTIYLDHPALIEMDAFENCVDDVLFNMTACISNLVEYHPGKSAELIARMKELLGHASLPQNLKEQYMKWLSSDWNDESTPKITTETVKKKKEVISTTDDEDTSAALYQRVDASEEAENIAVYLATVADVPEPAKKQKLVVAKTGDLLVDWLMIGDRFVQDVPMQANYGANNHQILMASPFAFGNGEGPQPLFVGPQPLNIEDEWETAEAMHMLANAQLPVINKRDREYDDLHQNDDKRRKF